MERYAVVNYDDLEEGSLVMGFGVHVLRWDFNTMGTPKFAIVPDDAPTTEEVCQGLEQDVIRVCADNYVQMKRITELEQHIEALEEGLRVSHDYEAVLETQVKEMHAENQRLTEYADNLAGGLPEGMLPKDVENLKEANWRFAQQTNFLEHRVRVLTELCEEVLPLLNKLNAGNTFIDIAGLKVRLRTALQKEE